MTIVLEKQFLFAESFAKLIQYANSLGYKIKIGEVLRSDEQAEINALGAGGRSQLAQLVRRVFPLLAKKIDNNRGNGIRNSLHCLAIAGDVQLFTPAGAWITESYPYELLADFWEGLGPDHKAGVRWGDTPHFSIQHEGAK